MDEKERKKEFKKRGEERVHERTEGRMERKKQKKEERRKASRKKAGKRLRRSAVKLPRQRIQPLPNALDCKKQRDHWIIFLKSVSLFSNRASHEKNSVPIKLVRPALSQGVSIFFMRA